MTTLDELAGLLTCSVPKAGQALGIGRDAAYAAAARGEIPTLRLGRTLRVPVPKLLQLLGVTKDMSEDGPADPSTATTNQDCGGPGNDKNTLQLLHRA